MKAPDLSKLTKEQKLEWLALLDEKQKRELLKRPSFRPHEGQMPIIMSEADERYLFCGNAFGKSAILVNEVHWAATGYHPIKKLRTPLPAKLVLLLDSPEKIEDFITEYRKWNPLPEEQLHKRGKPHYSFITYDNGSTVTVLTHEVNPMKLEGSQWTHIFGDEPPPAQVFKALFRGMRIKGQPCKVLLAGTPIAASWLRTDVYEPWVKGQLPHVECFKGSSEANKENLADGFLEKFSQKLSEKERQIRLHGEFFDLSGLALAHLFKRDKHIVREENYLPPSELVCVVVTDCHPSKPSVSVLVGADRDNQLYVIDEFSAKAVSREYTQHLIKRGWFRDYHIIDIVVDSLGSADSTSGEGFRSFIEVMTEELRKHRIGAARATRYDEKNDEEFIDRIQSSLAIPDEPDSFGRCEPKLKFYERCRRSIHDVENVSWLQDKANDGNKPKLAIANRDFLSGIKYALATNINFKKPKSQAFFVRKPVYGFRLPSGRARYGVK